MVSDNDSRLLVLWMRDNGACKGPTWNVFDANAFLFSLHEMSSNLGAIYVTKCLYFNWFQG
jgi:hypothetical protein